MTPIERLAKAVTDACEYLNADAEAWEMGSEGHAHEVYLKACARLRREVADELSEAALIAVATHWADINPPS